MDQISMFETQIIMLESYEDIDHLLANVREDEKDDDLFSWNPTSNGRSYSFYGTKVFEFIPRKGEKGKAKLKVSPEVLENMGIEAETYCALSISTDVEMKAFVDALKKRKHFLFRNLITETFACCNDYLRCSEAEVCIHQDDRFYNGCTYRTNLEQGKIFYGPKRNID